METSVGTAIDMGSRWQRFVGRQAVCFCRLGPERIDAGGAAARVCGGTCVEDVAAIDILGHDAGVAHGTRAKSRDTFGVVGLEGVGVLHNRFVAAAEGGKL